MNEKQLEKEIKDILYKKTDEAVYLRDKTWDQIDKRLGVKKGEKGMKAKTKKYTVFLSSAAAALIILLVINTQPGHALIKNIKELLLPEKVVEQDVEGIKERNNVKLEQSRSADYAVYVDEENYKMITGDDKDKIVPKKELPERYPEVFMEIKQVRGKSPGEIVKELAEELNSKYQVVYKPQKVKEPVRGMVLRAIGGSGGQEWNDPVVKYYVLDNQSGGSFIIKQQYFMEAEEGHGARFDNMLKEFYIIKQ